MIAHTTHNHITFCVYTPDEAGLAHVSCRVSEELNKSRNVCSESLWSWGGMCWLSDEDKQKHSAIAKSKQEFQKLRISFWWTFIFLFI